jgi:hypothetical protein
MTIEEFLQQLYGDELSDMFAGNRNSPLESRAKLFPLMNSGMDYAYAKWKLKYASTMLSVVEGTTEYVLPETDILQVTQLINVYGLEVPQNEYQVLGQTIYFPYPQTQTLEVVYKVKPTKFTTAQVDSTTNLELPDLLVPWLKAYVCYRFFASMATEVGVAKATHFLALSVAAEDLYVQTNTTGEFTAPTSDKLASRGFC